MERSLRITTLFSLLALSMAFPACQPGTPPVVQAAPQVATPPAAPTESATAQAASGDSPNHVPPYFPPDELLNEPMWTLLQQHDLAPLWAAYQPESRRNQPLEGFYGPPYYRISFYFSNVTRDTLHANVFHVTGLDRFRKVITPFRGTITIQTMRPFTREMFVDAATEDDNAPAYTAVATFVLREDSTTKGAGNYQGQALLDFYITSRGRVQHVIGHPMATGANPTKGSGLVFQGAHVSNQTGGRKSVAFSTDYGAVVPPPLKKLGIGDRSEEVNPNLARLGWNEAWENEEWWAASPKPRLSL